MPQGYQLVTMPMDGNCMYHGTGYQVGMQQGQVRAALIGLGSNFWHEICDWTRDAEQQAQEWNLFVKQTERDKSWGGAIQLTVAARIWDLCIHVHHPRNPTLTLGKASEAMHFYWHGGH